MPKIVVLGTSTFNTSRAPSFTPKRNRQRGHGAPSPVAAAFVLVLKPETKCVHVLLAYAKKNSRSFRVTAIGGAATFV